MENKRQLLHHVFFWLQRPESQEDQQQLIEGIRKLEKIEAVHQIKIGIPASTTKRPVIDNSYQVSLLAVFDSVEQHDRYQEDPIHLKFVDDCSHLWNKVKIYDAMDI